MSFDINENFITIATAMLCWGVFAHWAACLHVVPGLILSDFNTTVKVNAWYENEDFRQASFGEKYYYCLYKSVKAITGSGFIPKMDAITLYDKTYVACIVVIGRIALCVTFALMFNFVHVLQSSSLEYIEIISQLDDYAKQKKMPKTIKTKLKSNYNYLFQKKFFYEKQILNSVPATLKQQILIHNTIDLVKTSTFFQNLPSHLIIKIVSSLTKELFLENDKIYSVGNSGTSIYFIFSGSVAFYSPSGIEICHFKDGDYFGEICLMTNNEYRHSNVIALETTECYK